MEIYNSVGLCSSDCITKARTHLNPYRMPSIFDNGYPQVLTKSSFHCPKTDQFLRICQHLYSLYCSIGSFSFSSLALKYTSGPCPFTTIPKAHFLVYVLFVIFACYAIYCIFALWYRLYIVSLKENMQYKVQNVILAD